MAGVKIILTRPHIEAGGGAIEFCVSYRFTEAVEGVMDGEVGYEPDPGLTEEQILDELKAQVVAHANLQTSNVAAFTTADLIMWET